MPISLPVLRAPVGGWKLALENASPTIMLVAGCASVVGGVILACNATLKAESILDEIEAERDKVEHVREITSEEQYSDNDYKHDKAVVCVRGGAKLAKLYLPAVIFVVGGLALIIGGHKILLNRNLALAAAYETVSAGYERYRSRVKQDLGDEKDLEYAYGLREEVVGTEEFIDDDGKKHKQKIKAQIPSSLASAHAFYWDDTCAGWDSNPYYNETFLIGKQREWNRALAQRWQLNGFVTLAEIKQDLGVLVRPEDIALGWIYQPNYKPEEHNMKDQIDFGIFSPKNADAINGSEPVYILEPNVQGNLYHALPSRCA